MNDDATTTKPENINATSNGTNTPSNHNNNNNNNNINNNNTNSNNTKSTTELDCDASVVIAGYVNVWVCGHSSLVDATLPSRIAFGEVTLTVDSDENGKLTGWLRAVPSERPPGVAWRVTDVVPLECTPLSPAALAATSRLPVREDGDVTAQLLVYVSCPSRVVPVHHVEADWHAGDDTGALTRCAELVHRLLGVSATRPSHLAAIQVKLSNSGSNSRLLLQAGDKSPSKEGFIFFFFFV